jgi:hypothetical protein
MTLTIFAPSATVRQRMARRDSSATISFIPCVYMGGFNTHRHVQCVALNCNCTLYKDRLTKRINMRLQPLHQTFITAVSTVALLSISLGLLNNLYTETDLTKPKGKSCDILDGHLTVVNHENVGKDDRALLYGAISVQTSLVVSLIFSVFSFLMVLTVRCLPMCKSNLDLESTGKYKGFALTAESYFDFYAGKLFRAASSTALLSALIAGVLVTPALHHAELGYLGTSGNETRPEGCQDLGRDAFQREDDLDAIFILSLLASVFVGMMIHAVKYDIKASEE